MCGIVGYIGSRPAADIVVSGLKKLEYRGYDSAGLAVLDPAAPSIGLFRAVGKIAELDKAIASYRTRERRFGGRK